ncbi:MAG: hypothetical protein QM760_01480 [Nibricoccus sp.]
MTYQFADDSPDNTDVLPLPSKRITVAVGNQGNSVPTTQEEALEALRQAIFPYKRNAAAYMAYKNRQLLQDLAG